MKDIKISIVMPVYNVALYLREMLDSILNQTIDGNFQLIIINDGSTDESKKIIEEYKSKFNNLLYLEQENKGVSVARNLGIRYIEGKYTIFLDSDDYIEKDMFKLMYDKAEEESADTVICGYKKVYDYKNKYEEEYLFKNIKDKVYNNLEVCERMLSMEIEGFTWNKLFLSKNIRDSIY
ncbi:MAG: glycosyltransferase family 2 protein, partial [Clostridium perfringens]